MLKNETIGIQNKLANYCKDGTILPIKGVKEDRLHHYRRLVYNISADALRSAYPITVKNIDPTFWKTMVDDFIKEHKCQHPQLFMMPGELIDFAKSKDYTTQFNIPYLIDLLRFEWIEVAVHSMKDIKELSYKENGDLLNENLCFTPYLEILTLEYPIHQIRNQKIDQLKGNYYQLVFRDKIGTVHYLALNEMTYHLVNSLISGKNSLIEVLSPLVSQLTLDKKQEMLTGALQFIRVLVDKEVILGVK